MPFSRRFYPKRLTVMCAYILRMGGPGNRTHYPGVTSAKLYQLSYRRLSETQQGNHLQYTGNCQNNGNNHITCRSQHVTVDLLKLYHYVHQVLFVLFRFKVWSFCGSVGRAWRL